jgi:hypothetical protein
MWHLLDRMHMVAALFAGIFCLVALVSLSHFLVYV